MTNVDEIFSQESTPQLDPRARFWVGKKVAGNAVSAEFLRPWEGITFGTAQIQMSVDGGPPQLMAWSPEVDLDLLRAGIRAPSIANETERFGTLLGAKLRQLEVDFGGGFFNSVFISELRSSGWAQLAAVKEKLDKIQEYQPYMEGTAFPACVDGIDATLRLVAQLLSKNLGYDLPAARGILAGAIAYYLDDHYSIRSRQLFGF